MKNYSTPTCEVIELELENAILSLSGQANDPDSVTNGGSPFNSSRNSFSR